MLETDRTLDTKGWPERYFAVIFTAQRSLSGDDIYDMTADRMVLLAQSQPGFLGVESVRGDDGIGITVNTDIFYLLDVGEALALQGHQNLKVVKATGG